MKLNTWYINFLGSYFYFFRKLKVGYFGIQIRSDKDVYINVYNEEPGMKEYDGREKIFIDKNMKRGSIIKIFSNLRIRKMLENS